MKKLLSLTMGLAAGALFAVPVPSTSFITFSTQGPDKYADGSVVADGEAYALVWSKDGVFEGLNADGSAKDANDKVLYIGNFAKDGCCGTVAFEVAGACAESGSFDLWLLDTRVFDNGQVVKVGKVNDKVTISRAVKAAATVKASATTPGSGIGAQGGAVAAAPTVDLAGVQQPKITQFKVDGDYVVLEMEGVVPGVNYSALGANTPGFANPSEGKPSTATGDKLTVIVPKVGDRGFFKGVIK